MLVYGGGAATEAATLNADAYGAFVATAAAVGSVSTVAQLQSYDLVVLATNGSDAADAAFATALREWVQQGGGSLVALGQLIGWKGATNPDIEAVLPVDLTNSLNSGEGALLLQTTDTASPIVKGVNFGYGFTSEYEYALPKPGADDYAGTPQTDRNLYVESVTLDGVTVQGTSATPVSGQAIVGGALELLSNGTATFAVDGSAGSVDALDAPLATDEDLGAAPKPHLGKVKAAASPAKTHGVVIDIASKIRDVALPSGSAASAATWHKAAVSDGGRRRPDPVSITLPAA